MTGTDKKKTCTQKTQSFDFTLLLGTVWMLILKEIPGEDTSQPENVETVQVFPLAGFV